MKTGYARVSTREQNVDLSDRGVGLQSLNDPIDTTTAQGRLIFNIFASLAEFERELPRERTRAGLSAARARGRMTKPVNSGKELGKRSRHWSRQKSWTT